MVLTPTHKFILFALGSWYREANKKLKDKQLEVSISKAVFVDMIKQVGIVEKQPRAIYKNLELLEKKKLIKYKNKSLSLTNRGDKIFSEIYEEHRPYINVLDLLVKKDPLTYSKRIQTRFSS